MSVDPKNFICPITQQPMKNPYTDKQGITYDYDAIRHWILNYSPTSPVTHQPLTLDMLTPNLALKAIIEDYYNSGSHPPTTIINPQQRLEEKKVNLVAKKVTSRDNQLFVQLTPANEETTKRRMPTAFLFIIDNSGSMGETLQSQNRQEETGASVFTKRDLVVHSVKTVVNMLAPDDMVSIVTFNSSAQTKLSFTRLQSKLDYVLDIVDQIRVGGGTNIWDGLREGLDNVKTLADYNINVNIVLLTDGESNFNPPDGVVKTLEAAMQTVSYKNPFSISTFGFGFDNSFDSVLLNNIAMTGNGTYGYIPDQSMVGTIFVNWAATALTTYIQSSKLKVVADDGLCVYYESVGPLRFEQPREMLIALDYRCSKSSSTAVELLVGQKVIARAEVTSGAEHGILDTVMRYEIMSVVNENIFSLTRLKSELQKVFEKYEAILAGVPESEQEQKKKIQNFLYDYEPSRELALENRGGQIRIAASTRENFDKWGKHYLQSLMNAYKYQVCNNFKDPGVQTFAQGELFQKIYQEGNTIFAEMPALLSSGAVSYNTASYITRSSVCFDGEANVFSGEPGGTMSWIKVKDLRKGMTVYSFRNDNDRLIETKVVCVVKTMLDAPIAMCKVSDMWITPYHPIKVLNSFTDQLEWIFPASLYTPEMVDMDCVYNLVVEDGHVLFINYVNVVTLGHGFTDNAVISHPYFGTQQVIDDLKAHCGWTKGLVEMKSENIQRGEDGLISKIV